MIFFLAQEMPTYSAPNPIIDCIWWTIFILFFAGSYLFPAIIAKCRKHNNYSAILVLNLFLGWSFLGWIVALVWASTNNVRKVA
jgi:hypothetical protein